MAGAQFGDVVAEARKAEFFHAKCVAEEGRESCVQFWDFMVGAWSNMLGSVTFK